MAVGGELLRSLEGPKGYGASYLWELKLFEHRMLW